VGRVIPDPKGIRRRRQTCDRGEEIIQGVGVAGLLLIRAHGKALATGGEGRVVLAELTKPP
jgi:hypothetical protein